MHFSIERFNQALMTTNNKMKDLLQFKINV